MLHYHDYLTRRKNRVPMCRTNGWDNKDKIWREDDGDSVTRICMRCEVIENRRMLTRRATFRAERKRRYWRNPERESERRRKYYEESREAQCLKSRLRYRAMNDSKIAEALNTSQQTT